jgi:hypothetical protein
VRNFKAVKRNCHYKGLNYSNTACLC